MHGRPPSSCESREESGPFFAILHLRDAQAWRAARIVAT